MPLLDERALLFSGTLLFLLGLLTGVAMPLMRNARMGLSAHLVGVQHGMVLWVLGLMSTRFDPVLQPWILWTLLLGLYGLWLAMLLAAIWGASRALPMAGAGHTASPPREAVVGLLVYGPAGLILAGVAGLLWRLC